MQTQPKSETDQKNILTQTSLKRKHRYEQWTNTGRSLLQTSTDTVDDFIDKLTLQLPILASHNFIAKRQAKYLCECKDSLWGGMFIVICNISENYAFAHQHKIRDYHWAIHPFVIYFKS